MQSARPGTERLYSSDSVIGLQRLQLLPPTPLDAAPVFQDLYILPCVLVIII